MLWSIFMCMQACQWRLQEDGEVSGAANERASCWLSSRLSRLHQEAQQIWSPYSAKQMISCLMCVSLFHLNESATSFIFCMFFKSMRFSVSEHKWRALCNRVLSSVMFCKWATEAIQAFLSPGFLIFQTTLLALPWISWGCWPDILAQTSCDRMYHYQALRARSIAEQL